MTVQQATQQPGRVMVVATSAQGSAAFAWTGTDLELNNAADFDRSGGTFILASDPETVYQYTGVVEGPEEGDPDVVTTVETAPTLPAGEFRVDIWPPTFDTTAEIVLPGDDDGLLQVEVPHALKPLLADGVREPDGQESVSVELQDSGWKITDVHGYTTPNLEDVELEASEAWNKAQDAVVRVDDAQDAADAAAVVAEQARIDALEAFDKAMDGVADAGEALQAAQNAVTAAGTAQTAADDAQTAADAAQSDLATLAGKTGQTIRQESKPTGARANVNNLWIKTSTGQLHSYDGTDWVLVTDSRLIAAADAADQAANLAGLAQSAADNAQDKADAAELLAGTAVGDAENARLAALGAQGTADGAAAAVILAQQAAVNAQSDATTALDDLTILAGKTGQTIRQESAPTGTRANSNNLWIKTSTGQLYAYDGTWKLVTDTRLTAAAAAAAAAQIRADKGVADALTAKGIADQAQADALSALSTAGAASATASTANGRYTVATVNPTNNDAYGKPPGAVWEVRAGANISARRFVLADDGPYWNQIKAGRDFIGNEAIGQAQIGDLAVGTAQIANLAVTDAKIGSLTVGKLTVTGGAKFPTVVVNTLVGQTAFLDALHVQGGITVGGPNKVGTIDIADGAITAPKILTGALDFKEATGMELTAGKIVGTEIIGVDITGTSTIVAKNVVAGTSIELNGTRIKMAGYRGELRQFMGAGAVNTVLDNASWNINYFAPYPQENYVNIWNPALNGDISLNTGSRTLRVTTGKMEINGNEVLTAAAEVTTQTWAGGDVLLRRYGRQRELFINLSFNMTQGNTVLYGSLVPSDDRPPDSNARGGAYFSGGYHGLAYVGTNGEVGVTQRTGGTRTDVQAHISWLI